MIGLSPDQTGHLFYASFASIVLVQCAASVWLHKHRHMIRGTIRKLMSYL